MTLDEFINRVGDLRWNFRAHWMNHHEDEDPAVWPLELETEADWWEQLFAYVELTENLVILHG